MCLGFLLILPSLCTCTLVLPPICTLVSVDGFSGDIFRASSQIVRTHLSVLAPEEAVSSTASREVRHPNSSFYTSDMTEGQIWERTGYCPEWTGLPMEIMISSKAGFDEGSLPCIRVCGTYEEGCGWGMLTHLSASHGISLLDIQVYPDSVGPAIAPTSKTNQFAYRNSLLPYHNGGQSKGDRCHRGDQP